MIQLSPVAGARALIVLAVVALALAVGGVSALQRSAAETTFRQSESAALMLAGMLDQQTGVRGFTLTGDERFLGPYNEGRPLYAAALAVGRDASRGDPELRRALDALDRTAKEWQRLAVIQIRQIRRSGARSVTRAEIEVRKRLLDRFRRLNGSLRARLRVMREEQLSRAGAVAVAVILSLSVLFGVVGHLMVQRAARARRAQREAAEHERSEQAEFAEAMLVARDEQEANDLVKRHLERTIVGGEVTVISRGVDDQGLRTVSGRRRGSPLERKVIDAGDEACMAIRLGRPHDTGSLGERLLCCELCGSQGAQTFCVPSVVGTEMVGAVLVERAGRLDEAERARVRQSVSQSAPVLANLRTVSGAELRALTDHLTGLPNKRAVENELRGMAARAGRAATPLAAVLVDVDHFKRVNDTYGHEVGDHVLAAVAEAITATVRTSDFAGRYGGEEFVLLLPDTGAAGAMVAAENVRREIERLELGQVEGGVTASFGVAVLPDHAAHGESLLRQADRALYVAKDNGRNRVEMAPATTIDAGPSVPA